MRLNVPRVRKGHQSKKCHSPKAKLDRIRFGCNQGGKKSRLPALPGFEVVSDVFVRGRGSMKPYHRVRRLQNPSSGTKAFVEYQRNLPWVPNRIVTLIGDDEKGLQWKEVEAVYETLGGFNIILVELALDFQVPTRVNLEFVRRYFFPGKSRLRTRQRHSNILYYGSRYSTKFYRVYGKVSIGAFRVEVEIHRGLLKWCGIVSPRFLWTLARLLYPRHIQFVHLNWDVLKAHLARRGLPGEKILRNAQARQGSLHDVLRYLRREAGISNPHRFLRPLKVNRKIRRALNAWADSFTPPRRGL